MKNTIAINKTIDTFTKLALESSPLVVESSEVEVSPFLPVVKGVSLPVVKTAPVVPEFLFPVVKDSTPVVLMEPEVMEFAPLVTPAEVAGELVIELDVAGEVVSGEEVNGLEVTGELVT